MKEIANYEGLYAVTSCGRVWSYRKERFLIPRKDRKGYLTVLLCNKGNEKEYKIHRLVATAYIPNCDNLPQVNHKDENKQNNCISNLEWCTNVYNRNYGTRNERAAISISKAKMKPCMCLETGKTYPSVIEAAKDTNFHKASISKCCRGERKSCAQTHWKYI
jgi:hypothetical protein